MTDPSAKPAMLIVEDAFLVGLQLKRDAESLGFEVLGPAPRVDAATPHLQHPDLACAMLDVNLGERDSAPIAEALRGQGIPFLFITGYESTGINGFPDAMVLRKPVSADDIAAALQTLHIEIPSHRD